MLQSISGAEKNCTSEFASEKLYVCIKKKGKDELAVDFPRPSLRLGVPGGCGFDENRSQLEALEIKRVKMREVKVFVCLLI